MDINISTESADGRVTGGAAWTNRQQARGALLGEKVKLACSVPIDRIWVRQEPSEGATKSTIDGGSVTLEFGAIGTYVLALMPVIGQAREVTFLAFEADALSGFDNHAKGKTFAPGERRETLHSIATGHAGQKAMTGRTYDVRFASI